MDQINNNKIITDCGKEFELNALEPVSNGNLNSNQNYTFTIYRTPTQEYIQKKSFFNPSMNHTSTNYEVISESAYKHIATTLAK
jgi:hypothetical protein